MAAKPREPGPLRIRLLGRPGWSTGVNDGELTRKHAALVACVAVQGRVERDSVAALLWDSRFPERRRDSLYQHIATLRTETGHAVFLQDEVVAFAPGVACDLDESLGDWPPRELLARSRFLDGGDFAATTRLDRWVQSQRIDWRERICAALVRSSARITASDELARAVRLARELTEEAPMREGGWRALMWLQFLAGDHAAAVAAHEQVLLRCAGSGRAGAETERLWQTVQRGIAGPRPQRGDPGPLHPPLLVGRKPQQAALESAWRLRRPLLLVGEGGIGKSRLLGDFLRRQGRAVIVGSGDGDAPYATLATLLRALLAQRAGHDRGGPPLDAATRRTLTAVLPELGRAKAGSQADPVAVRLAVARVLEQAANDGLLAVALDDVHRADAASLAAIRAVAGGAIGQRLFFAFAARPLPAGALRETIDDWRAESQPLTVVEVPPLTRTEVAALIATLDLVGAPARVGADALYAHVGGNPLFVLETLREVAQQQSAPEAPLPRPGVAVPVLERRIGRVPARARPLLQLAAVLDADIRLAAEALGLPAAETAAMHDDLQALAIVRDGRFAHDLMREAAAASLSAAERSHWHGVAAATLDPDRRVPRARVAGHWEIAGRWSDAGAAYRLAADAAIGTGSYAEARRLLVQAAACQRRAGDADATFDALYESLAAESYLADAPSVERLAAELGALAATAEQRARAAIASARGAILRYRRSDAALRAAAAAADLAAPFPHLQCDAMAAHAVALAQAERHAAAIAEGRGALALAEAGGRWRQAREIASDLLYVYYEAGRYGDAIVAARALVDACEAAGDIGGAGAVQGNLAMVLLSAGDPVAAIAPAESALKRHRQIEPSATAPLAVMTRTALGSAYAAVGRFGAALDILVEAGRPITDAAPATVRPKAALLHAHVWLTLGEADRALAALGSDEAGWLPAAQIQRCWALARAARLKGVSDRACLDRIAAIQQQNSDAPITHTAWLEWSRQGDARSVAMQMARAEGLYAAAGMPGTARSAALRRLDRLNELDDDEALTAAGALARVLRPTLHLGLHPLTYIPEALATVARALARDGDARAAAEVRTEARHWILEVALPHVAAPWRDGFLQRNPVNLELLGDEPAR